MTCCFCSDITDEDAPHDGDRPYVHHPLDDCPAAKPAAAHRAPTPTRVASPQQPELQPMAVSPTTVGDIGGVDQRRLTLQPDARIIAIVGSHDMRSGRREYKVRWENSHPATDSWLPEWQIPEVLVQRYERVRSDAIVVCLRQRLRNVRNSHQPGQPMTHGPQVWVSRPNTLYVTFSRHANGWQR